MTRSLLLMCGGHFNSFYLHAQKMPVAQVLNLFETWIDVKRQMQPDQGAAMFKDVSYE